ncbi:MAG: hypothetical protein WBA77_16935 [Microcoleaceae cyanobacterium]
MKHILLLLGLIASTGLTAGQVYEQVTTASKSELKSSTQELLISLNYEGTNEDGEREGIETER